MVCGRSAFVGAGRRLLAPPLVSDGRRRRRHSGAFVGEARAAALSFSLANSASCESAAQVRAQTSIRRSCGISWLHVPRVRMRRTSHSVGRWSSPIDASSRCVEIVLTYGLVPLVSLGRCRKLVRFPVTQHRVDHQQQPTCNRTGRPFLSYPLAESFEDGLPALTGSFDAMRELDHHPPQ